MSTEIRGFESVDEFLEQMRISEQDLLITNAPIYEPYLKAHNLKCRIIYQENYGAGEPNDKMINSIIRDLDGWSYGRVFALGGGTVIDVAKILALTGVGDVLDALYGRVPLVKGHKLIVVPTTCGTGSEVTNIAILEDTTAHVKKGIVGPAIYPDEAILVPELVQGLPYKFFAFSSIDALIHAIESYLAPASNCVTEMFAINAIQEILAAFQDIASNGPETRTKTVDRVLLASTYAGIAFGNTGVGAIHAMSYPLGGMYHVAHGEANYAFLDVVLRKYDDLNPNGKIADVKKIITECLGVEVSNSSIERLTEVLDHIIPLKRLKDYGVQESELEAFTEVAMAQERLMKNNYVRLKKEEVLTMYQCRY